MTELFLIAHVADRTVAISTDQVESVVDIGDVTPVPCVTPQVRGLAALRSRVVTVISSRYALGHPADSEPSSRAILTMIDGHHYAILVNALEDVEQLALQPLSSGLALTGAWADAATGIVDYRGEPILAITLKALVPSLAAAA